MNKPAVRLTPGLLSVLAVLQMAWLGWFLSTPLPNATPVGSGSSISRGLLLFSTMPGLNPGFRWSQSLVGQAVEELSGFASLVDRLPVMAIACLIMAGAWGLGLVGLRVLERWWRPDWLAGERMMVSLAIGVPAWGTLTLIVGRIGMLEQWQWILIVVLFSIMGWAAEIHGKKRLVLTELKSFLVSIAPWPVLPFVLIMLLASMLPTIDFDCIEYHLQGPKEYWQQGRITYLPHNIYTNMPFGVEMLHTSAMSLAGDWKTGALAGQLLIGMHPLLAAGFIQLFCRRCNLPAAGWWGAVFYLSAPWTYRLASIPYVEGPLCAAMAAWVFVAMMAWNERRGFWWICLGVVSGWAMSCKYTAILPVVVPGAVLVVVAIVRLKSFVPLVGVVVGGTMILGPWLAKNVIDTGNPVYPLAWNLFGGIDWDAGMNAKWSIAHGRKAIKINELMSSLVDVLGRSDWQSPLFMAFLPIAFLTRRECRKVYFSMLLLALWIFVSWWFFTHRLDRFWLPVQPVLAILAGMGAGVMNETKAGVFWRRGFVFVSLVSNWIYCSSALAGLNEWTKPLETLWKSVPNRLYPASVLVDGSLKSSDRALLVGQAAVFYWEQPILYNTVFNREGIEILAKGKAPVDVHKALKEIGITHVFVDWSEIRRYRQPGNYGFTDFVTEPFFD
ncbi:MAG: glycosyltransferase family 39 protein, partial [bacterium]